MGDNSRISAARVLFNVHNISSQYMVMSSVKFNEYILYGLGGVARTHFLAHKTGVKSYDLETFQKLN